MLLISSMPVISETPSSEDDLPHENSNFTERCEFAVFHEEFGRSPGCPPAGGCIYNVDSTCRLILLESVQTEIQEVDDLSGTLNKPPGTALRVSELSRRAQVLQ